MIAMASGTRTDREGYYRRSCGWFISVPIIFNFREKKAYLRFLVGGGKDYVDKARHEAKPKVYRYHQPNDEYDESWWDFDGAMEDMNLMFSIGLVIANNDEMPKWTKEADFQRQ